MNPKPLVALLLCAAPALGAPVTLVHQGRLVAADDTPVNEPQALTFSFHTLESDPSAEPPPPLWVRTFANVAVQRGLYSVVLAGAGSVGGALDTSVFAGGPVYLQVTVSGTPLAPRLRVGSVPVASYASEAGDAQRLGGKTIEELKQVFSGKEALDALKAAGTLNAGTNPVDWTQLKNVPAGFSDGTDDSASAVQAPLSGSGRAGDPVVIAKASADADGYLGKTDFAAFAAKVSSVGATPSGGLVLGGTAMQPTLGIGASGVTDAMIASVATSKLTGTIDGALITGQIPATAMPATLTKLVVPVSSADPSGPAAGTLYWNTADKVLKLFDGGSWQLLATTAPGCLNSVTSPASSCQAFKAACSFAATGPTWLKAGSGAAFLGYCDQTTEGGGWTLVARQIANVAAATLETASAVGTATDPAQTTAAKLADASINAFGGASAVFRQECAGRVNYFKLGKDFSATTTALGSIQVSINNVNAFNTVNATYSNCSSGLHACDCSSSGCWGANAGRSPAVFYGARGGFGISNGCGYHDSAGAQGGWGQGSGTTWVR